MGLPTVFSASTLLTAAGILSVVLLSSIMGVLRSKSWKPAGKHVFITGGSQGLGLALAERLAARGANVTICSRTESKLRDALEKVKVSCPLPPSATCAVGMVDRTLIRVPVDFMVQLLPRCFSPG